ncbi:kinase-like protein [Violaceomyces palustris]|uniref:Kinase-like protein n=1 Tax=Violaceomyces palustris TaxID=1673888 RepID=A0ACD0P4U9_9BASI|nr:kinase-like protein [Violaceomyces palustris]
MSVYLPEEALDLTLRSQPCKELERLEAEIRDMEESIEGLDQFQIVDKLGEGTFSSVYKAIDLNHHFYDNYAWTGKMSNLDQDRPSSKHVHVALKRIYVTSSPSRILNELDILEQLRDAEHISYLITAFRSEDQIVAVMPYSRHADFRDYYRIIPICDLKCYFRCLFRALRSAHAANIIHRDVKPANFLYDPKTGEGTLCDFGLAERFEPSDWRGKCHHTLPTPDFPHGRTEINRNVQSFHFNPGGALAVNSSVGRAKVDMGPPERVGYLKNDTRPGVRANRAGTRGFRAPEVLFKCQDQTPSLDIWSAGIILLAFLTKRFPLFNSNDDTEALLELATIFGKRRMEQCALLHNRTFLCNIPSIEQGGQRIVDFIVKLNPRLREAGSHPDPDGHKEDVEQALDLARACLHLDCTRRWTANQILNHPFLAEE